MGLQCRHGGSQLLGGVRCRCLPSPGSVSAHSAVGCLAQVLYVVEAGLTPWLVGGWTLGTEKLGDLLGFLT